MHYITLHTAVMKTETSIVSLVNGQLGAVLTFPIEDRGRFVLRPFWQGPL